MDSSDHAIVIGAGLGGLAAAMRLGAKGWRVSVFDPLDRCGGRASSITQDGYRFDLGPTIVTVPDVYEKLWLACGRRFRDDVDLRPLDPGYTIRWQNGDYYRAYTAQSDRESEVERLSPQDLHGYRKYLNDAYRRYVVGFEGMVAKPMHRAWDTIKVLPTFGVLRADQSILGLVKRRIRDPRLRMALSYHPLLIGGDPRHVTSMYALVSHLESSFGIHYAMGGVQALADAMARVIRDQGGQVLLGQRVDRINTKDRRVSGVTLEGGRQVTAPLVISNADPGHTYTNLLRERPKRRWSAAKLKSRRWSMGLYLWYFGLKGTRDKWPEIGHHTILSGPRYEGLLKDIFIRGHLAADMSLYLHRPSVTDPSVAPAGGDVFYALSPVPHLGHKETVDWAKTAPIYKERMARVLQEVIPGFQAHIETDLVFTPETFRDRYHSPYGAGFSLEPRILQSAWFRPHNRSEEVDGLYLVGAGTHPGAGVPGVVSSAEVIDQLIPQVANMPKQQPIAAE